MFGEHALYESLTRSNLKADVYPSYKDTFAAIVNRASEQEIIDYYSPYGYVPTKYVTILFIVLYTISSSDFTLLVLLKNIVFNHILRTFQWHILVKPSNSGCGGSFGQSSCAVYSRSQAGRVVYGVTSIFSTAPPFSYSTFCSQPTEFLRLIQLAESLRQSLVPRLCSPPFSLSLAALFV
jgi:hypothetical protein